MTDAAITLIGLGAIGAPIADKLNSFYQQRFALVASGNRRMKFENKKMYMNGVDFSPRVISSKEEMGGNVSLLIVCIKNYDLEKSFDDIRRIVSENTVILPLQNGIASYEYFSKVFPNNVILQGYVQGPNTVINSGEYYYKNSGVLHLGNPNGARLKKAQETYLLLKDAGVDVHFEDKIRRMVWKKWMLNVAGNSVTALTGADYSQFKDHIELQIVCRNSMHEFIQVALREKIELSESDIDDVINYYVTYSGHKRTSMLEDVLNERRTENEYLAGTILQKAREHNIELPVTSTLYYLVKIKESVYTERKLRY